MNKLPKLLKECPQCGASMDLHIFLWVCEYCGHVIINKEYDLIYPLRSNPEEYKHHTSYIHRYINDIKLSPFVALSSDSNGILISSAKPYIPNDGLYHLINRWSVSFSYILNKKEETLLIHVNSEREQGGAFAILLNGKYAIILSLLKQLGKNYIYEMSPHELYLVCLSDSCELSANLDNQNVVFAEFVHYCRRFYNVVFDHSMYTYSRNKILLTDKNNY